MIKSILTAAALAAGLGFAAPATAMPVPTNIAEAAPGQVEAVHYRNGRRHAHRRHRGRHYRHRGPRASFGIQLNFGPRYGYAPRRAYRGYTARHHAWCEGRYRSYRRFDGSYQPYHGPRRRCNSPYDGI